MTRKIVGMDLITRKSTSQTVNLVTTIIRQTPTLQTPTIIIQIRLTITPQIAIVIATATAIAVVGIAGTDNEEGIAGDPVDRSMVIN